MDVSEQKKLIDALLKGTVTVTFRKVDTGEIRIMPCTLNPKVLKSKSAPTPGSPINEASLPVLK